MNSTSLLCGAFALLALATAPSGRLQRAFLGLMRGGLRLGVLAFLLVCAGLALHPDWVPFPVAERIEPLSRPLATDFGGVARHLVLASLAVGVALPLLTLLDFLRAISQHGLWLRRVREIWDRFQEAALDTAADGRDEPPFLNPMALLGGNPSPRPRTRRLAEFLD